MEGTPSRLNRAGAQIRDSVVPTEMAITNPSPEAAILLKRAQEWSKESLEARNVESLQAFWTEDAILIPFEAPVVSGTSALVDYFKQALGVPGFHIEWKAIAAEISSDGKLGYLIGRHVFRASLPDGTTHESHGRDVAIWRKEGDGEWRWRVQIWNAEPPAYG